MRKTSTLIILLSVLLGLQASAQTLINFQGFEGTSSDTWNFTPTPATYNTEGDSIVDGSDDVWAVIQEFTGDIDTSSQGLYFWGMQDINNGNGGGNFYHTLDFDVVNLSAYMGQSVTVSFDYFSDGFDGTDSIEYQIAYDSSNVWAVNGIALNKNTQAWTTVSIQVPMNSPYVRLRLQALQNGSSDFAGFDNESVSASASLPAPPVTGFELISNTQIAVAFNHPVASPSATNTANYVATPALSYMGAMLSTGMDTVMLNLSSPIVDGTAYQVVIDSIVDTAGTMMAGPDTINFLWNQSTPSLVISEIMYNDPSGPDTLEYIEILNNGSSAAALGGLIMDGVTYEFAPQSLAAGAYVVLARNAANANSVFGVTGALQWTGGSLSNGGEDVAIFNSLGDTIDYVDYDDSAPWNTQADGGGSALVLCDVNTDNNDAANWWISNTVSATVGTTNLFGSPGSANTCATPAPIPTYPIATVTTNDAQGVADSLNTYCKVVGVVVGPDYDGNNGYS
ncbi:MAG: lamin tail domain-containing protein, partial [Salibacteraceae bacterium]